MSIYQLSATGIQEINVPVVNSTATTIVDATSAGFDQVVFVPWFEVNEINGGTHNLTVALYDGTNTRYLGSDDGSTWNAKAVTAKASYKFTQGYLVPTGSTLRVTSSDASGYFHVHGIVGKPF